MVDARGELTDMEMEAVFKVMKGPKLGGEDLASDLASDSFEFNEQLPEDATYEFIEGFDTGDPEVRFVVLDGLTALWGRTPSVSDLELLSVRHALHDEYVKATLGAVLDKTLLGVFAVNLAALVDASRSSLPSEGVGLIGYMVLSTTHEGSTQLGIELVGVETWTKFQQQSSAVEVNDRGQLVFTRKSGVLEAFLGLAHELAAKRGDPWVGLEPIPATVGLYKRHGFTFYDQRRMASPVDHARPKGGVVRERDGELATVEEQLRSLEAHDRPYWSDHVAAVAEHSRKRKRPRLSLLNHRAA